MTRGILIRLMATLLLSCVLVSAATADPDDDRIYLAPMVGHVSFDATAPWNSIDSTVLYGARGGVMVNRWIGFEAGFGYAFANGNYGWVEDGSGGFETSENTGKDVDVLYFGMDLTFHPMQGNFDPWASLGWAMLRYDYEFDAAGFKQWLSDNGATYDLEDLTGAAGWEFAVGCGYGFLVSDRSRWSVVGEVRDLWVHANKLDIVSESGEQLLTGEWGHNLVLSLGFELAWGPDSSAKQD